MSLENAPAAETPVSSPQSGEGELLREALEPFAALLDTESNGYENSPDDEIVRSVGTFGRDFQFITVGDLRKARTALTPAPRDQGSIQATSSASERVCDHLTTEWAVTAGARAIAAARGHDPDELAPRTEMVSGDGSQMPWWMVFEEEAEACLKEAVASASLIANQKNLRGSEPEPAPAGDASSRCDTGSKMR